MRVAINAIDDTIVIDGAAGAVDCKALWQAGIAAVQWHEDYGEIEYIGHVKPNEAIDDFSPYQTYVDNVEFPAEPEEPAVFEPPPQPPAAVGKGLAPMEQITLDHENRLRALERKDPVSEDAFMRMLHTRIDDYLTGIK